MHRDHNLHPPLRFELFTVFLALGFAAFSPCGQSPITHANAGEADRHESVLFAFDDVAIPFTHNLQLSMDAPEKHPGNPVLSIGRPGDPDEWQLRYYGTVLKHEGGFKMWYVAGAREGFETPQQGGSLDPLGWRFAYAESEDGIQWTKPDLGLMEFRGSLHNNLIQMPDGFRGYHALVRYEPEEADPTRRFKMLAVLRRTGDYTISQKPSNRNVYLPMYSPDGLRWRVADELTADDEKVISSRFNLLVHAEGTGLYKWNGMYYVSGQSTAGTAAMAPYGRHVQIWRSSDFLNWSETQTMGYARPGQFRRPIGTTGGAKPDNEQTHGGVSVWNRGNVLIGITGFWHGSTDWMKVTHDLGFLISNDGLHFREPQPEFLFARVGQRDREWDYGGLGQGQGFENVGDKTYVWYGAPMDQAVGPRTGRPWLRAGGIGLLVLDRDRFGSLSTRDPDANGSLVTSAAPATWLGEVWVNAEGLGPRSRLRVELLDELERPVLGFSGIDAAVLERSGLRVPVSWEGGDPTEAEPGAFKIKAHFEGREKNAIRLYAFYLTR